MAISNKTLTTENTGHTKISKLQFSFKATPVVPSLHRYRHQELDHASKSNNVRKRLPAKCRKLANLCTICHKQPWNKLTASLTVQPGNPADKWHTIIYSLFRTECSLIHNKIYNNIKWIKRSDNYSIVHVKGTAFHPFYHLNYCYYVASLHCY